MNGNLLLVDTNIVLEILNGNKTLDEFIAGNIVHLSFISELELLGFKELAAKEDKAIRAFINDCRVIDINPEIKLKTINLRKANNLKLPDSIIAATAQYLQCPLLTADSDFNKIKELEIIHYR